MCRILGWSGEMKSPDQQKKISLLIKGLILAQEENNPHGTGIAMTYAGGSKLVKKGIRGSAFILQGYADILRWQPGIKSIIGHVRYKTAGEQSDSNAHPFSFTVAGASLYAIHNGVIGQADALAKKYGVKPHAVDSATFFKVLTKIASTKGLVEAIKEATYEISHTGDFAFAVLYKGEIYLWRNDQRPLCIFDLRKVGLGRVFCSTKEMFEKAVKLSGISFKEKISYFEAKPYRLYKVGHSTTPKGEVELVCEIPHKPKEVKVIKESKWWESSSTYLPAKYRVQEYPKGYATPYDDDPSYISDEEWEEMRHRKNRSLFTDYPF